jgi:methyl-accepting chemotaxis protein
MDTLAETNEVLKPKNGIIQSITQRGLFRTILLWFLAISLVPLTVVTITNYQRSHGFLTNEAKSKLTMAAETKANEIQRFFQDSLASLLIEARLKSIVSMAKDLRLSFEAMGLELAEFVGSSEWILLAEQYGEDVGFFLASHDFYDFYIIDFEGNILFTDKRQKDLGTNVFTGKYSNTLFGKACRRAFEKELPVFSDVQRHEPSNGAPAGFLITLIYDEYGEKLGLAAVRVSNRMIDKIMQSTSGLGQQGEAYLVGQDLRMRSNSRLDDKLTMLSSPVETEQTLLWREKHIKTLCPLIEKFEDAFVYTSRKGVKVLGLHKNIEIAGVCMAVVTEIPVSEAFENATAQRNAGLFILALTVLFVVFLAFIVARGVTRPIRKLSDVTKSIADGNLDQKIPIDSRDEIGELAGDFRKMIAKRKQVEEALLQSEETSRKFSYELSEGLTEVFEALKQISSGNPEVRIAETSELDSITRLKHTVNMTAENIGEMVDLSHEFAIGLAEHFDVLNRVSNGDLTARVSGGTQVELLESLSKLTNQMIENVSSDITERKRAEEAG